MFCHSAWESLGKTVITSFGDGADTGVTRSAATQLAFVSFCPHRTYFYSSVPDRMAGDPRISDRELAAINAAAVTKEYRVQPHLGELRRFAPIDASLRVRRQITVLCPQSMGVFYYQHLMLLVRNLR